MSCILELRDIEKSFPGVKALDSMKIQLEEGEVHAVVGENGAGKSTMMKIITGVYHPDKGDVLLRGKKIKVKNPNEAYAKGIAIIYQETSLFTDMTVLDNMFLGHEPTKKVFGFFNGIDYKTMRERATETFERLGMEMDLDAYVSDLGVASKQMVEIAKALTYDADILILDEPSAALTNKEVKSLFNIINKLKEEGVSMLYISHRLEEIFEIADRVTVIRDGQYVETSETKGVETEQLISWMVGRTLDNLYPKTEVEIGEPVLVAKDIVQHGVLNKMSLTLNKGEIVGIAGLAGSGRTELAHALVGFTKIDSGSVTLDGQPLKLKSYTQALEHGIVYISEDRKEKGLVVDMSLKENISMPILKKLSKMSFINIEKEEAIAVEYIEKLSIKTPSSDFTVDNLSGGNQQKVSVAKALANLPKILILDEPTRGVDVGSKSEIHRIMSGLAAEGLSIIMISSDLPEIIGMSDRVYITKLGQIVGELDRNEIDQEEILKLAL
jgi:ABC-type sugar transport system ATPase subunit